MPCRVTAKRRRKKGENRPLFAFCAVLPTEQENTQPALQTLLTNGKIHIVQLLSQQSFHLIYPSPALQKKTEINSDRLWKRATLWCAGSPSHRNVAFSISNCLHRCFSCHALCKVVITVLLYSYRFRVIYKPSRWLSHDFFLLTFSRQISKAGSGNHNRTTGAAPRRFSQIMWRRHSKTACHAIYYA